MCWDLIIEPGEVIDGVTEMTWFSVLKDDFSTSIVGEQEEKKEDVLSGNCNN